MENTSPQEVKVIVQKTKSNASIYLGIIGFVLAIPALLCITVCAGAAAGFSELTEPIKQQEIDITAAKVELVKKIDAAKKNGKDVSELQFDLQNLNNFLIPLIFLRNPV
jgi:AMMECR1 domain-containing protein